MTEQPFAPFLSGASGKKKEGHQATVAVAEAVAVAVAVALVVMVVVKVLLLKGA